MNDRALEFERGVLGLCLREDEAATDEIVSGVRTSDFMLDSHRTIFNAIAAMHLAGTPISAVTLAQYLADKLLLSGIGEAPFSYIVDLTSEAPIRARNFASEYISRLKGFSGKRAIGQLGALLGAGADDPAETTQSLIELAQTRLEALIDDSATENSGVLDLTQAELNLWHSERKAERSPGLSFGVAKLDDATGGIQPGHQVVVAARSGVGKTNLMAQAINANCREGIGVDAFLLEPTRGDLLRRLWSMVSGVRYQHVKFPRTCPESEMWKAHAAAEEVSGWPLRIHDRRSMTLDEIIALARLGMHRYDTRLICVDYLQRVQIRATEKDEQIRLRIGRASTAIADLVKGTKASSMVLSQLNRRGTVDAIPTMVDLAESGQIERDAHTIVFLHRAWDATNGHYLPQGAILVPKQRFGMPCNIAAEMEPGMAMWTVEPTIHQPHWQDA